MNLQMIELFSWLLQDKHTSVFRFLALALVWLMSRPDHSPDFTTRTYVLVQELWPSNPA